MGSITGDRKPNKRDENERRRQRAALREIDRVAELGMNSDIGKRKANEREELDRRRRHSALRDIDRIAEQSEIVGTSNLKRYADKTGEAGPGDMNDPAEIWGRRLGRGLALAVLAWLLYYIVVTYLVR